MSFPGRIFFWIELVFIDHNKNGINYFTLSTRTVILISYNMISGENFKVSNKIACFIMIIEPVSGEMTNSRPIVIRRFNDVDDIGRVNILYINVSPEIEVRRILDHVKGKNILTVSDKPNFAAIGGMIGFYNSRNKVRMQINTKASREANLEISSKLLKVAVLL